MEQAVYKVKTENFEGPLDLLLHLIEKRKLFIGDVALSEVTDDFIGYIQNRTDFPIEEISQFILVASTLLLIKSKALLPMLELTEEEEGSIEDLELRLKEYKRFKELSRHIKNKFGRQIIFPASGKIMEPIFSPGSEISLKTILEAAHSTILSFPKPEILPKTAVKKVLSLEEMIERLLKRISESIKMSFKEFSGNNKANKSNIVISFLALLELVKRGLVETEQQNHFADIEIKKHAINN